MSAVAAACGEGIVGVDEAGRRSNRPVNFFIACNFDTLGLSMSEGGWFLSS